MTEETPTPRAVDPLWDTHWSRREIAAGLELALRALGGRETPEEFLRRELKRERTQAPKRRSAPAREDPRTEYCAGPVEAVETADLRPDEAYVIAALDKSRCKKLRNELAREGLDPSAAITVWPGCDCRRLSNMDTLTVFTPVGESAIDGPSLVMQRLRRKAGVVITVGDGE